MERGKKRIIFSGEFRASLQKEKELGYEVKEYTYVYKDFDRKTMLPKTYRKLFEYPNYESPITVYAGITKEVYLDEPEMDVIEKYFPVLLSLLENVKIEYSEIFTRTLKPQTKNHEQASNDNT